MNTSHPSTPPRPSGTGSFSAAAPVAVPGTVTVSGHGIAEAAPDLMLVSIGVESRAGSVEAAYAAAGKALAAVVSAFKADAIAAADIRTTGLSVRADLVWREGEGQRVAGYIAASSLSVRLRDLASASRTVSAAATAGGDDVRLHNLQLMIGDESALRTRARDTAWQNARATGEQFAALAGCSLGKVLSVTEGVTAAAPGPTPMAGMQRAVAVESLAVEAGENQVSTAVTVTWELLP